nr:GDP-mannose 4,6-dehydratase [Spirochaeta sp.]
MNGPHGTGHASRGSDSTPRRTLVTGGAGFIGSHLCQFLLDSGDHVVCMDNFSTGSMSSIRHLLDHPRFELIEHDVTVPRDIATDRIYNLACPASPLHYQRAPGNTARTNALGAINVLDLAQRDGAAVLHASTSEIYGDPGEHPQRETYTGNVNPVGVRACYTEGKRFAETLCIDAHREHNVTVKIARIFNTYGPRMAVDDGRVVSNFVVAALKGDPIVVSGEGTQTRSFCYVSDMVRGLTRFLETDAGVTGPINLGNPEEITIRALAEL